MSMTPRLPALALSTAFKTTILLLLAIVSAPVLLAQTAAVQMQCHTLASSGNYLAPNETYVNGMACKPVQATSSTATTEPSPAENQATADPGSQPLSNSDVSGMLKAGVSSDVVIAKIKTSPCKFDTSAAALEQLKADGVPSSVILAMVDAPAPSNGSAGPCIILKRMGPADEVTSHLYSFGVRGKQFQYIEGNLPQGVKFHGRLTDNDVRNIEKHHGEVEILDAHYTEPELQDARKVCSQGSMH
jgi:hypothetical protein